MKRNEDISILITNKTFQKILVDWNGYNENTKNKVCKDYNLNFKDVEVLRLLWLGLHFEKVKQPQTTIEQALQETILKLEEGENTITKSKSRQYDKSFAKIAAILIVPLISYTIYILLIDAKKQTEKNINQLVTVNSQAGTITNLTLPDGSMFFLNTESSITDPSHFSGSTRNVTITGEGYFKITENKQMLMITTNNLNYKAYTTFFNINPYPSENFQKVTLVKGSISLSFQLEKLNEQEEFFNILGQPLTYFNKLKELSIQKTYNIYSFTAWKADLLVFRNVTFESIVKQLPRTV